MEEEIRREREAYKKKMREKAREREHKKEQGRLSTSSSVIMSSMKLKGMIKRKTNVSDVASELMSSKARKQKGNVTDAESSSDMSSISLRHQSVSNPGEKINKLFENAGNRGRNMTLATKKGRPLESESLGRIDEEEPKKKSTFVLDEDSEKSSSSSS